MLENMAGIVLMRVFVGSLHVRKLRRSAEALIWKSHGFYQSRRPRSKTLLECEPKDDKSMLHFIASLFGLITTEMQSSLPQYTRHINLP